MEGHEETQPKKRTVNKPRTYKKKTKSKANLVEEKNILQPRKEQIDVLAKKTGVKKDDLYKIYDFDEKIHLIIQPEGKN